MPAVTNADTKAIYADGQKTRREGFPIDCCPLKYKGDERGVWQQGWCDEDMELGWMKAMKAPGTLPAILIEPTDDGLKVSDAQQFFMEGVKAFQAGIARGQCPYFHRHLEAIEWNSGWDAAENERAVQTHRMEHNHHEDWQAAAMDRGYQDHLQGVAFVDCPFSTKGSDAELRRAWTNGWLKAPSPLDDSGVIWKYWFYLIAIIAVVFILAALLTGCSTHGSGALRGIPTL